MPLRRRGNKLERWEIALIKAMVADGRWPNDQDILAYFTRPTRSINHRAIGEIKKGKKHGDVAMASAEELKSFLNTWPAVDPETGLSQLGDELLLKSRDAMIAAVHIFNSAGLTFRTELFIVTAMIAWTYLLHTYYKREGVDYWYEDNKQDSRRYWDLKYCIDNGKCPVTAEAKANLETLWELRNKIERRSTGQLDDLLNPKLQACCLNFNNAIKNWFGHEYALDRRLSIALQFSGLTLNQTELLKAAPALPRKILTEMSSFEEKFSPEIRGHQAYECRVALQPQTVNNPKKADLIAKIIPPGGATEGEAIVAVKQVEKPKFKPKQITDLMNKEGWPGLDFTAHTELWQRLNAKREETGYGVYVGNQWYWYESWVNQVRGECEKNPEKYRSPRLKTKQHPSAGRNPSKP